MSDEKAPDFEFRVKDHTYWHGSARLFSVTEVLDLVGLIPSFCKEEERAHEGKAAHFACQLEDEGDLREDTVHPVIVPYLEAWRRFKNECGFKPEIIEKPFFREDIGLAGTPDRLGFAFEKPVIIDIKTGQPQAYWAWQLAGYSLLTEAGRLRYSVQLTKEGKYKLHRYDNPARDRSIFQSALVIARVKGELYGSNGNR